MLRTELHCHNIYSNGHVGDLEPPFDSNVTINEQLEKIKAQLGELNNDFSIQVNQDNLTMLTTYDVIQKNVVLLKVDMLQKLNISVDYADADGD